jgi:hypothetical protein
MSTDVPLPLNEPQQRHITIALAGLEKHLAELRERLERGPQDLRLTQYRDPIGADEAAALLPAVRDAEAHLRNIADDFGLDALTEPVRRALVVALEQANINVYECLPSSALAGYGAVAPVTAEYLEREIPKLESAVRQVLRRLIQPDATWKRPTHG